MDKRRKTDIDKAADLVRDAGGRIVGRTRLQKIAFLLELTGLGDGFDFEYRHYGPYSEQLANAISTATLFGKISEEERQAQWGGSYSVFSTDLPRRSDIPSARMQLIDQAAQADPIALELAATAAFLAAEGEKSPWDETARRKPDKATHLAHAKTIYSRLTRIDTPKPLPCLS